MKISLIGMSNTGKSFWAKELEKIGFERYCCDDLIEQRLGPQLKRLGYRGIADVSKWLGQPYDERHLKNSRKYLSLESQMLHDICLAIDKLAKNSPVVIDTTGSVIYARTNVLERLAKLTKIIYLEVPAAVEQKMYELYIKEPKPVVWCNAFSKQPGEVAITALGRCYPQLLRSRAAMYKQLANVTVDSFKLRQPGFDVKDFVQLVLTNF